MLSPYFYKEDNSHNWQWHWLPDEWSYKQVVEKPGQFCALRKINTIKIPAIDVVRENYIVWIEWNDTDKIWNQA